MVVHHSNAYKSREEARKERLRERGSEGEERKERQLFNQG